MELQEAIYLRRSIRKFKDTKVKEEDIKTLLELAMAAPSACNKRPWEFYVVTNEEVLKKFNTIPPMMYKAPCAIIVCGNKDNMLEGNKGEYFIQDGSAAIENILLGALSLSLGTVWCGITPQEDKITLTREYLNLPDNIIPLGLIYVGYPDEIKEPRTQYEESKVHYIK